MKGTRNMQKGRDGTPQQIPAVLSISEWRIDSEGQRWQAQEPRTLVYSPCAPISCGGHWRNTLVLQTPGAPPRLATLLLDGHGRITVTPVHSPLRLDGQVIEQPLDVSADEPHVIATDGLELCVELANALPEAEAVLFRRAKDPTHPTDQPPAQHVAPEVPMAPPPQPRAVA